MGPIRIDGSTIAMLVAAIAGIGWAIIEGFLWLFSHITINFN